MRFTQKLFTANEENATKILIPIYHTHVRSEEAPSRESAAVLFWAERQKDGGTREATWMKIESNGEHMVFRPTVLHCGLCLCAFVTWIGTCLLPLWCLPISEHLWFAKERLLTLNRLNLWKPQLPFLLRRDLTAICKKRLRSTSFWCALSFNVGRLNQFASDGIFFIRTWFDQSLHHPVAIAGR